MSSQDDVTEKNIKQHLVDSSGQLMLAFPLSRSRVSGGQY